MQLKSTMDKKKQEGRNSWRGDGRQIRVLFASFCDGFGIFSALCLWPLEARTVVGLLSTGGNSSEGSVQLAVKALLRVC